MIESVRVFDGFFNLSGQRIFGSLKMDDDRTLLTLRSDSNIPVINEVDFIWGTGFDHKTISCLQCVGSGTEENYSHGGIEFTSSVFPHYVCVGDAGVDTSEASITEIFFTTSDLAALFNDSRAFGHLFSDKETLTDLLTQHHARLIKDNSLGFPLNIPKISDRPHIFYFTGNMNIFESATQLGVLSVGHRPNISIDGKSGISFENNIEASLKFSGSVNFDTAIDRMLTFSRFISTAAGRTQQISNIRISKHGLPEHSFLDVYCSFSHSVSGSALQRPNDAPIDPIYRPKEFSEVLVNWINREDEWSFGRIQYLNGLAKSRSYDSDRLVAAANAFDILPSSATVADSAISDEYNFARRKCLDILETLPVTDDRASAIGVLKRWGRANLRSKVLHRAGIVKKHIPQITDEIDEILVMAIKTRNYFVHGTGDFDYPRYESFLSTFTDALEFVFSASDFIECGWEPKTWLQHRPTGHHNYSYFISTFSEHVNLLRAAKLKS